MKSFIFILLCVICLGQLKAQTDSSKFVIHDAWLISGLNVTSLGGTSLETMKGFEKGDGKSLLSQDYSLYERSFGYRGGTLGLGVSTGVSWRFADPKKKWQKRSRFRTTISYNKSTIAVSGCQTDSVSSAGYYYSGSQPAFQIEKHKNTNLSFLYNTNIISAGISHVFSTPQEKLISAHFGYSIGFGGALASYIDAEKTYREYDSEAKGSPPEISYDHMIRNDIQQEKIKAKGGLVAAIGMPMGINVRLSKKKKVASHFNLGLEIQPKLSCFYINNELVSAWQLNLPMTPYVRYQFN